MGLNYDGALCGYLVAVQRDWMGGEWEALALTDSEYHAQLILDSFSGTVLGDHAEIFGVPDWLD